MSRLWNVLSLGIFLLTLGFLAVISVLYPALIPLVFVIPISIVVFGFWLVILAFIKKASKTTRYESPPLMVGGWGILLVSIGMLLLFPSSWILILAVLVFGVGLIAIAYSFMKKT